MKIDVFIEEARRRGVRPAPEDLDPLPAIATRIAANRWTLESQALLRACLAVAALKGEIAPADLWSLDQEVLGLFNAYARRRLNGDYGQDMLDMFVWKLGWLKVGQD